jgi:hypothetical protein
VKRKSIKTETILVGMQVIAWLAVSGYIVQAGAIIISFAVSCVNPEGAKNLYMGLNLFHLRESNFTHYVILLAFMVVLLLMKSSVWFLVTTTLRKITIRDPFKIETASTLEKMSYVLFIAWIVSVSGNIYTTWLLKITGDVYKIGPAEEFIFMAGIIYIISQIFKRGVEIQSENELTV